MRASRPTEREPLAGEQQPPRADAPDPAVLPARRAHRGSYRPAMTTTAANQTQSTPLTADAGAATDPTDATPATGARDREQHLDVLVIGAGQAGLALAWHLNQAGAHYLVVDAAPEVGHAWRTRWDSLRLFTPSQ